MTEQNNENSKLIGLMAQFDDPHTLVQACDAAREQGYKKMDAFSPFPVHGIDPALGIPRTILPFICLAVGLGACVVGLGMQYYTNAADWSPLFPGYAFKISGKPYFSLPANIPVTFEVIVLSTAFAAFFGMWGLNKLPMFANPLHRISRFKRVTNDRFFLVIESADSQFDYSDVESKFNAWGATAIEEVREDLTDQELPSWLKLVPWIVVPLLLIPPVFIYRAMGQTNRYPRLHVVPDMDWQHKFKTQTISPDMGAKNDPNYLFAENRSAQTQIPGTIARGQLVTQAPLFTGIQSAPAVTVNSNPTEVRTSLQEEEKKAESPADAGAPAVVEPNWVTEFPSELTIDEDFLNRGQQRFNIYCSVCHGYNGNGDGLVNQRALALAASGNAAWTAAKSLHDPTVKVQPVGRIYDTITNGRASMGPYKDQIPLEDRWAIVAYVKALQETGIEPPQPAVPVKADEEVKQEADQAKAGQAEAGKGDENKVEPVENKTEETDQAEKPKVEAPANDNSEKKTDTEKTDEDEN